MASKEKGLLLVDTKTLKVTKSTTKIPLFSQDEKICDLRKIKENIYCASTAGHIYKYSLNAKNWRKTINPFANKFSAYEVLESDNANTLFIASGGSDLLEYNLLKNEFVISEINNKTIKLLGINSLHYDQKRKSLLITTYGQGLFVYDYGQKKLDHFKQHDPRLNLAANYPLCIMQDVNGVTWIGYDGRGVDVLAPNIKKFSALKEEGVSDLFSLKFVRKIMEGDNDHLWFATAGSGLVQYNRSSEEFKFFNTANLFPEGDNFIVEMIRVKNELWLGFNGQGIGVFDMNKKKMVKKISAGLEKNNITDGTIWSYLWDRNANEVWIGTRFNGINIYNLVTNTIEKFDSETIPAFKENGIRCLYQTKDNKIYIGTEKGLYTLSRKNKTIKKVFSPENSTSSLESIKCIYEDANKNIWLGTDGAGLIILNSNFEIAQQFSSDNLLKNNIVYGILSQSDKSYWLSSNAGLTHLKWNNSSTILDSTPTVFHYDLSNGLQSNEYNTSAYLKLSDGQLAFGGVNGVDIFKGEDVQPNKQTPKTIITDFSIFSDNISSEILIPYVKEINLKYRENSFAVNYNTLGFTIPEKTHYKYQLVGYDKKWIEAGSRTYASYTNLNPGDYEFRVMASNYDGFWSQDYSSIKINIATPFYKQFGSIY